MIALSETELFDMSRLTNCVRYLLMVKARLSVAMCAIFRLVKPLRPRICVAIGIKMILKSSKPGKLLQRVLVRYLQLVISPY